MFPLNADVASGFGGDTLALVLTPVPVVHLDRAQVCPSSVEGLETRARWGLADVGTSPLGQCQVLLCITVPCLSDFPHRVQVTESRAHLPHVCRAAPMR